MNQIKTDVVAILPHFLCLNCKMMFFVVKEDEARRVGSDPVLLPCIAVIVSLTRLISAPMSGFLLQ